VINCVDAIIIFVVLGCYYVVEMVVVKLRC